MVADDDRALFRCGSDVFGVQNVDGDDGSELKGRVEMISQQNSLLLLSSAELLGLLQAISNV
jgi:hypothetical protein